MRVAMYYNNRDIRIEELPRPQIKPGEALLKTMASGICGSDVLEWYRIKKAPIVLGHEVAGELIEVGDGITPFKKGDRVFVNHHVPCNTCKFCRAGNHTVCETLHTTNFFPGGFSEMIQIPQINVERGMFLLPDNISYEEASFIEPLACVIRGQRFADIKPGYSVLILGSGISGLLHLLCARSAGAGIIGTTDISQYRLDKAKELGADFTINAKDDVPELARKYNRSEAFDLVIVCTGAMPAFIQALHSVERGGTILCFATTDPDVTIPLPINQFWRNGIKILPSYANSPFDAEVAIKLLEYRRIDVKPLISHQLPLEKTGLGFQLMVESGNSLKVIIEPNQ